MIDRAVEAIVNLGPIGVAICVVGGLSIGLILVLRRR